MPRTSPKAIALSSGRWWAGDGGWIIYTWDARLVDGSTLRLPRQRVRASDGGDMERVPRKVDVEVPRPLGESLAGKDSQLDEAIRVLLRRLGRGE
jgi:hypothetical protein